MFPIYRTLVEVLHQTLRICFTSDLLLGAKEIDYYRARVEAVLNHAEVETVYRLYNPLDRVETLRIAFAIPGYVAFPRPPVLLDGVQIDWEYLNDKQVLQRFLPAMKLSLEKALATDKRLRTLLEEAYRVYLRKDRHGGEFGMAHFLRQHFKRQEAPIDNAARAYVCYREGKPVSPADLADLLVLIGHEEVLPWARWDARLAYLHPMAGRPIRLREVYEGIKPTQAVSLLMFKIELQPQSTHELTRATRRSRAMRAGTVLTGMMWCADDISCTFCAPSRGRSTDPSTWRFPSRNRQSCARRRTYRSLDHAAKSSFTARNWLV